MIHTKAKLHNPRFLTPSGVAETGRRDGRDTQEALARSGVRLLAKSLATCAIRGRGSSAAPTGHASFDETVMWELNFLVRQHLRRDITLLCFCAPKICHCDVIAKIVREMAAPFYELHAAAPETVSGEQGGLFNVHD